MLDIKDMNVEFVGNIVPNVVPLIPSAAFVYLFLTVHKTSFFVLAVIALFFLSLDINFNKRLLPLVVRKTEKFVDYEERGLSVIKFMAKDSANWVMIASSLTLTCLAFLVMVFTPKDIVIWILLFLCLLVVFYYITAVITYVYVVIKYPKFVDITGQFVLKKSKSLSAKKKTTRRKA